MVLQKASRTAKNKTVMLTNFMSEQKLVLTIKELITDLPADQAEAVYELAEHIRAVVRTAGEPVGTIALALVGAEAQCK